MAKIKDPVISYAQLSREQTEAITDFVTGQITQEVNFGVVRSTLPQVVVNSGALVKVNNRNSGAFYAVSEQGLKRLVVDAVSQQRQGYSFFDGMESFSTGEKVGLSVLDNMKLPAAEYSDDDLRDLHELAES